MKSEVGSVEVLNISIPAELWDRLAEARVATGECINKIIIEMLKYKFKK